MDYNYYKATLTDLGEYIQLIYDNYNFLNLLLLLLLNIP